MTKPNATYLTERSAYYLTLGHRTSSHTSVFCIYASAGCNHSARPRETSSWLTSTTCQKKKKKLQPLSSSHPVPHHYKFTTLRRTIYTVVFVCKTHLCIIFVGYFTTLSVIQTIKCQMEVWFMNDELERIWKKKEHSQDSRWCRWDMNQAVPKYKYNLMLLMSLCMRQGYELSLPVLKNYLESTWNKLKNFL